MSELFNNPALVGLIVAIPSFILGILAYSRSLKVDKTTAQSEASTNQLGAVNQVIDGLNKLIENLQEDNKSVREAMVACKIELQQVRENSGTLLKEVQALNKKYKVGE